MANDWRTAPSPILAQLGELLQPQIPPLDEPPIWQQWLFESPTLPAIVLAVLGLILLLGLIQRAQPKQALIAFAIAIAAAGGIYATATVVQTEREMLKDRTADLINATATADLDALAPMLDKSARIEGVRFIRFDGRDAILNATEEYLGGRYRVASHRINETQAQIDGANAARTQVAVAATPASDRRSVSGWWLINWQRDPRDPDAEWRVTRLELLHLSVPGYTYSDR